MNDTPPRAHSARPARSGHRAGAAGSERGSATVLTMGAMGVLAALAVGTLWLLSALVAAAHAASVADLAALAAARALAADLPVEPCAAARSLAGSHRAQVSECVVEQGGMVSLTVTVSVSPRLIGTPAFASARARAGPAP